MNKNVSNKSTNHLCQKFIYLHIMCTLFNFVVVFAKQIHEFILKKESYIKGIENLISWCYSKFLWLFISKPKMNLLRDFICNFGYIYNIQMIMQVQCSKWISIQFEINCNMKKN
jgi:hypothetical protein